MAEAVQEAMNVVFPDVIPEKADLDAWGVEDREPAGWDSLQALSVATYLERKIGDLTLSIEDVEARKGPDGRLVASFMVECGDPALRQRLLQVLREDFGAELLQS